MPPASVRAALVAILFPLVGTTVVFRLLPRFNLESYGRWWLAAIFAIGLHAVLRIPGKASRKFKLGIFYSVSFWVIAEIFRITYLCQSK